MVSVMTCTLLVRLSNHARARAAERGIPTKEVKRCVREPDYEYGGGPESKNPGVKTAVRGDVVAAYTMVGDHAIVLSVMRDGRGREEELS